MVERKFVIDDLQSSRSSILINDQKKAEGLVLRDRCLTIKKRYYWASFHIIWFLTSNFKRPLWAMMCISQVVSGTSNLFQKQQCAQMEQAMLSQEYSYLRDIIFSDEI